MPKTAKIYVYSVVLLGLTLLACCLALDWTISDPLRFAVYFAAASLASMLKIKLPGLQGTISLNFVTFLVAMGQLSLQETLVTAAAATLIQCLWRARTRPRVIQILFNIAALNVSIFVAYEVPRLITKDAVQIAPLGLAAFLFFVFNTGLVSLVLSLISHEGIATVWRRCHGAVFPYYLIGAAFACAINASNRSSGWRVSMALLPMMYLVYAYYREHLSSAARIQQEAGYAAH